MKKIIIVLSFFSLMFSSCEKDSETTAKEVRSFGNLKDAVTAIRPDCQMGAFYQVSNSDIIDKEKNDAFFKDEMNSITLWAGMISMWHGGDDWRFESEYLDERYAFARKNNLITHIHPLIGPNQYMPFWLVDENAPVYTEEQLRGFMTTYITTVLERYPEAEYVDVVNEAVQGLNLDGSIAWATDDNVWMGMGWYNDIEGGIPQYMIEAYQIARRVNPDIKLIYNENNNSMLKSPKGMACYKLYLAMKEAGVKIDAIGLQMHMRYNGRNLQEDYAFLYDFNSFVQMAQMYAPHDVELHVTELDIELPQYPTAADIEVQGDYYAKIASTLLMTPNVKNITIWGVSDKYSWIRDWVEGDNGQPFNCRPLMLDELYRPKPAYTQMLKAINSI